MGGSLAPVRVAGFTWNGWQPSAVYAKVLSNLLQSFEHQGKDKQAETIKRASPVAWQSINLKGKYLFNQSSEMLDIEYLMAPIEEYIPFLEK